MKGRICPRQKCVLLQVWCAKNPVGTRLCLGQSLTSTVCLSETSSASVLHCQVEVLTASRVSEANCHYATLEGHFLEVPKRYGQQTT